MSGSQIHITCLLLVLLFICMGAVNQPGVVVLWIGKFALIISLLTLLISAVTPWIFSFRESREKHLEFSVSKEEKDIQLKLVRKEQEERVTQKANYVMENVVKPREESKFKKKEERFYKMTGQSWKLTEGFRLGIAEDEDSIETSNVDSTSVENPNKEALRKRKLPEHVTRCIPKPEQPWPKKVSYEIIIPDILEATAEVIALPEEPDEVEGVVTVALRCPSGRVFRRRFYKTCSSHVLLDWMTKVGYHYDLYALYTSSPRYHIEMDNDLSLDAIGIVKDTLLNVEQNYPS
uniref:UBX domain-containing protein n=1 Tax=Leptobrachium leishanense TaxID=445787 RepID=A0A8C5MWN2_9ANUR